MVFATDDCIEAYELLKTYFRKCTILNNFVPVRPWFDDEDEEEQWVCGYRDDVIAEFKQDLYNEIFSLRGPGKCDENATPQEIIKF